MKSNVFIRNLVIRNIVLRNIVTRKIVIRNLMLVFFLIGLGSGCVRITNSSSEVPTVGEQIVDLTKAKQAGALTEEEFKRIRKKVLAMI